MIGIAGLSAKGLGIALLKCGTVRVGQNRNCWGLVALFLDNSVAAGQCDDKRWMGA